jgi:hypothetical protein
MKTKTLAAAVVLTAGLAAAGAAQAAGKIYVGAKLGLLDADPSGCTAGCSLDPAFNIGAYGGYNMLGKDAHWDADLAGGTLAVEGEATLTAVKGDAGLLGDWDMTSIAAYAAYRHPMTDAFYLKGKLGVARYEIDTDFGSFDSETALAAGIGAGWSVGPGSIEAEITTYEGDILFVTAGFHMSF